MMGFNQKLIAGGTMLVMNLAVWVFTLLFGGLFLVALSVMFTAMSLGAAWKIVAV